MVFMVDYHFWEFLRICKTFGKFRAGVKTAKFSRFSCFYEVTFSSEERGEGTEEILSVEKLGKLIGLGLSQRAKSQ